MSTRIKTDVVNAPNEVPINQEPIDGRDQVTRNGTRAPNALDIIASMSSCSQLSREAEEYIKNIDDIIRDAKINITSHSVRTNYVESRVYVHEPTRFAVVLLFEETYQSYDATPITSKNPDVANAIRLKDNTISVVEFITVTKEEYNLYGNMAAFIINAMKTLSNDDSANIGIDQLRNLNIHAITSIDFVRKVVQKFSPHKVPDRDDIGVVLCFEPSVKMNPYNKNESDWIPFLAITGFTRILCPEEANSGGKFVPIPTITNIVSAIPNASLLSIALPLAVDAFITQNIWTRPYMTFATGKPNLGNLNVDPTSGAPFFVDTNAAFHNFINTFMTPPFLAVDITDGRARPVGIDMLDGMLDRLLNRINRFFNMSGDTLGRIATRPGTSGILTKFYNYTGTYQTNGEIKDTRFVDYLNMASILTNPNREEMIKLLNQKNQPNIHLELVRSFYPDNVRSLYTTTTIVLDADVVAQINEALYHSGIQFHYDVPQNGCVNFSNLLAQIQNNMNPYANIHSIGIGTGPSIFNKQMSVYPKLF